MDVVEQQKMKKAQKSHSEQKRVTGRQARQEQQKENPKKKKESEKENVEKRVMCGVLVCSYY